MTAKRNPVIGWCDCVICGAEDALVSQERATELLYYNCPTCKCVRMKGGEFQAAISRSLYLKGKEKKPEEPDSPLSSENESSELFLAEPVTPLSSEKSETIETIEATSGIEIEPEPEPKKTESGWFEEL